MGDEIRKFVPAAGAGTGDGQRVHGRPAAVRGAGTRTAAGRMKDDENDGTSQGKERQGEESAARGGRWARFGPEIREHSAVCGTLIAVSIAVREMGGRRSVVG